MQTHHDELRDELVAILSAGRELTADTDAQLADAFIRYLDERDPRGPEASPAPVTVQHPPPYALKLAGGAWGAALMFLFLLLLLDNPRPIPFLVVSVLLLSLVALATRLFLSLARSGWRIPHVRITVSATDGGNGKG